MDSFTVTAVPGNGKRLVYIAAIFGAGLALIVFYFRHYGAGVQHDAFGYAHELPLLAGGLYLFFRGFREIRKKWLIENTPTSKARSVALGCVEVTGTAQQKTLLKTPLTAADCVLYRFLVERQTRDSKGRTHWRTVRQGVSTSYFYVEDETGRILVDPLGAEAMLGKDYFTVEKEGLFGPKMRYSEWYIKPGDYVYVLGTAKLFADAFSTRAERLAERLRQMKQDTADLLQKYDTDKDGQLSIEEWDKARAAAEEAVRAEEEKEQAAADALVIGSGDNEKTFIISDHDESEVAGKVFGRSLLSSAGGFAVSVLMFAAILARAGILNKAYAISWHLLYR